MTEELREAVKQVQREYLKQWRGNNPERVRAHNARFWEKKAAAKLEQTKEG